MSRNHRGLKVFELADGLAIAAYQATRDFPFEERFGLRGQVRRAAVSVPTNIVEGCSRRGHREYVHFLDMALGSASELRYLFTLCHRLGFLPHDVAATLDGRAEHLVRTLQSLLNALSGKAPRAGSDL
jgi:four helix bundle protein